MNEDEERALAGALIWSPSFTEQAYVWLDQRDILDRCSRFVVALIIEAWHQSKGTLIRGPHWESIVARALESQGMSAQDARYWIEDSLDRACAYCTTPTFAWLVRRIAALGAYRRIQTELRLYAKRGLTGDLWGRELPVEGIEWRVAEHTKLLEAAAERLRHITIEPTRAPTLRVGQW